MSDITPIRPDIAVPEPKRKLRGPRGPKVDQKAIDAAINAQRGVLFQAMGIVRLVSESLREPSESMPAFTDAWTALDGAYALMGLVADRLQDSETMLAEEVSRGEY